MKPRRKKDNRFVSFLRGRRGVVLLVVLVVVMMLSLGAYTYVSLMRSHRESSVLTNKQLQAKMMVDSGVDYLRIFLIQTPDAQFEAGGKYNNPTSFKQLPVLPELDPKQRGYATVVAPALDDEGNLAGVRFGLEDESTKLNLNTLLTIEKSGVASLATSGDSIAALTANMPAESGDGSADATAAVAAAASALGGQASGASGGSSSSPGPAMASSSGSAGNAARTFLMAIPSMTEEAADSILDWIDEDDEAREYGAELDYYMSLEPPYAPKNGPLDTVEELLRVKGVSPQMLFGSDTNRNGQIDPNEAAGGVAGAMAFSPTGQQLATSPATTTSGSLDRGWSAYLTLHSRERNLTPEGQPRIFLNNPDLTILYDELSQVFPQEWASFIVAYRQGSKTSSRGSSSSGNSSSGSQSGSGNSSSGNQSSGSTSGQEVVTANGRAPDLSVAAKTKFTQVLDLIDARIQVKFAGEEKAVTVQSPFKGDIGSMNAYMALLMDYVTVNPAPTIPGRVNILQAPAPILRGIPGINDDIVQQVLNLREPEFTSEKPNRRHETWLLTEGVVSLQEFKLLQPFICSSGHVYKGQVVGYFQSGEAAARAEVIFDATGMIPRVVLWRDMSHLGRGYALETLGIDYAEMPGMGQSTTATPMTQQLP